MMNKKSLLLPALAVVAVTLNAQEKKVNLSGSVQSDMMIAPQTDNAIGAYEDSYDNKSFLNNTYLDLVGISQNIDFGGRFELTQWPMPGFNDMYNHYKGWGVPNLWIKGKTKHVEATLGSFYEQFGSGFVLRSYEERSLGVDNSLMGLKLLVKPVDGVQIKLLSGLQRHYWSWNTDNLISGADLELNLESWSNVLKESNTHLTLGASWVNKYEKDDDVIMADAQHMLRVPEFVNAMDFRATLQKGDISLLAEYAIKQQDPNSLNNYTYGQGSAAMLSLTYGKKGLSVLAQAKRSENMGFRSRRTSDALCSAGYINHLPAFTLDHTYALAALYPYATQVEGEWAFQGSVGYNFKRNTSLGGKYGTKVKLNYSLVRGLENNLNKGLRGTDGVDNSFFGMGAVYYQDLNVQMEKRLTKEFDIHLMYMYQQYNKQFIQSESGNIYSNIFVAEGKYKFSKKYTLRAEAQYLTTEHDSDDWLFGLVELSIAPRVMLTASDLFGRTESSPGVYGDKANYYNFAATYNYNAHRIMLSFGRTRAGFNCTGGVCRYVPASKGLTVNYNYTF